MMIAPESWTRKPKRRLTPAVSIPDGTPIGVTISSAGYAALVPDAVARFQKFTGLQVVVLWADDEPSFGFKLCLDQVVAPRPIVFFDVDLWFLKPFDFTPYVKQGGFYAVHDHGAMCTRTFAAQDCERNGWDPGKYFNSGLIVCDLSLPDNRQIFATARELLKQAHEGHAPAPVDRTDQYFLNAAAQGFCKPLPHALNFFSASGATPPQEVIGLHAAGIPLAQKLETLRAEARIFEA